MPPLSRRFSIASLPTRPKPAREATSGAETLAHIDRWTVRGMTARLKAVKFSKNFAEQRYGFFGAFCLTFYRP